MQSRADYEKEMVEGSKDKWVVLHLYQDSVIECRLLANHLRTVVCAVWTLALSRVRKCINIFTRHVVYLSRFCASLL